MEVSAGFQPALRLGRRHRLDARHGRDRPVVPRLFLRAPNEILGVPRIAPGRALATGICGMHHAYLEKEEMDAILKAPDKHAVQGFRDYALLLFLYNCGARADEAAHVGISDLDLGGAPSAKILGKGNKIRRCPLWAFNRRYVA